MISPVTRNVAWALPLRAPTEYLAQTSMEQLSQLDLFLLVKAGFALEDVQAMVSVSKLYTSLGIIKRIVGTRGARGSDPKAGLLTAQQGAVAFQFAKALEHATTVFGTLQLAEEWLGRPCRHLSGQIPLDLIDNSIGFQVVEDYLERIELGVYQ